MGFLNPNNWFSGSNDPTAYTNMNGGGTVAPGQLAYQGVGSGFGQNSLDQYLRSLQNYGGQSGQGLMNTGGGYVGKSGDYWSNILSGNPSAIAQAMAPTINSANAAYKSATNTVDKFAPMGGGRSSTLANAPYAHAGAISNIIAQAQPLAAQNLASLGTTEQSLGIQQLAQVLQSLLEGRGQDVTETGQNKALAGNLGSSAMNLGGNIYRTNAGQ